jgi:hypothetical protein
MLLSLGLGLLLASNDRLRAIGKPSGLPIKLIVLCRTQSSSPGSPVFGVGINSDAGLIGQITVSGKPADMIDLAILGQGVNSDAGLVGQLRFADVIQK